MPARTEICPRCGVRNKHYFPNSKATYCLECIRVIDRIKRFNQHPPQGASVLTYTGLHPSLHEEDAEAVKLRKQQRNGTTALAPMEVPLPVAVPESPKATKGANGEQDRKERELAGVLADLLLLTDRCRLAAAHGSIDSLHMAVEVEGVRVRMGVDRTQSAEEHE